MITFHIYPVNSMILKKRACVDIQLFDKNCNSISLEEHIFKKMLESGHLTNIQKEQIVYKSNTLYKDEILRNFFST